MKFTTRTRYGLKLMIELARIQTGDQLVQLAQIAQSTQLSIGYLAQLVVALRHAGLVWGVPGKKGGYRLTRMPETIQIGEILKAMQGPVGLTDCVLTPSACRNSGACDARLLFCVGTWQLHQVLNTVTLADMINGDFRDVVRTKFGDIPWLDSVDKIHPSVTGEDGRKRKTFC